MHGVFETIFGVKDHLSVGQECARAVLIFFYGLVMVRLSGPRTFAQWSALDIVISIIAGSSMSRMLTGSASMPGTFAAVTLLFALHMAFAHGAAFSETFARLTEGSAVTLAKDGVLDHAKRNRHAVSLVDIDEALREKELNGLEELANVERLVLEPDGKFTVLKKVGPQKMAKKVLEG